MLKEYKDRPKSSTDLYLRDVLEKTGGTQIKYGSVKE